MTFWTTFRMTYVIHQPNFQRNLTLVICMSSARRPHEISTQKIFPLKEQTALLKIKEMFFFYKTASFAEFLPGGN